MSGKVKVWGNVVTVEWADPIEDPDPEVMAKVSFRSRDVWKNKNLILFDTWRLTFLFVRLTGEGFICEEPC